MSRQQASEFGPDDWAWAVETIADELAAIGPDQRNAVAQRLAARLGYIEVDPADERWRLLCRLSARLCDAALDEAA
jgi:hypothetical protein